MRLLLIITLAPLLAFSEECKLRVSHQFLATEKDQVLAALLELSIAKSGYSACFSEQEVPTTLAREIHNVAHGRMSLMWSGTSLEAEKRLKPIRIPVFRGLLGYRVLVIRNGEQQRFNSVKSIEDLQKFKAGVGNSWGDKPILESAVLPLVTTAFGPRLFTMLVKKRFDYMAFGIFEGRTHLPRYTNELSIEENIVLHYPTAFYFYVHPKNVELYKALTKGMNAAIADGSYDELLFNSKLMRNAVSQINLSTRHLINIPNPHLPKDTPLDVKHYWLNPLEQNLSSFLSDPAE